MKVLDWTETFGIYSKLILASVVPSIVPICKNLAMQKSFTWYFVTDCTIEFGTTLYSARAYLHHWTLKDSMILYNF